MRCDAYSGVNTITAALEALRAGRPVLVVDDPGREGEGDVVLAAQTVSPAWMAWTIRHTSGFLCAPMTGERADALGLPPMVADNQDPRRTAYTVSCDAAAGITTGISAADRTRTVQTLADPSATPTDLIRPGHILPLRARDGGVLTRAGHTEAAVDLMLLAGLAPVGVIGELTNDDGTMMSEAEVQALGRAQGLVVLSVAELVDLRKQEGAPTAAQRRVVRGSEVALPTPYGQFRLIGYQDAVTDAEVLALIGPAGLGTEPLVRIHSECFTGDALGSLRCDCGPQLQASMREVAAEGGVVIYVRGHEGRGVGLSAKLDAYAEQDRGADTVAAQVRLGLPVDAREYGGAVAVLKDLGVAELTLLTNNPLKIAAVRDAGLRVRERRPLQVGAGPANADYLETKRLLLGHLLPEPARTHADDVAEVS